MNSAAVEADAEWTQMSRRNPLKPLRNIHILPRENWGPAEVSRRATIDIVRQTAGRPFTRHDALDNPLEVWKEIGPIDIRSNLQALRSTPLHESNFEFLAIPLGPTVAQDFTSDMECVCITTRSVQLR